VTPPAAATPAPDSTAVRVALWRALHVQVDPLPHVLEDEMGLELAAPGEDWRRGPDMDPQFTRLFRASIVARSRFIEDIVLEQAAVGVGQYVILGSGLDTFAERRPEVASRVRIFEIDRPGHQAWKRQRLIELGVGVPEWLRLVSVDFDANDTWWDQLIAAGFDGARAAVVACAGVSMYLTKEAIAAMLRQVAALPSGSMLAMTFLLPVALMGADLRPGFQLAEKGARANGTPFISFFTPPEMLALAREAGLKEARYASTAELNQRYFRGRSDGLRLSSGEEFLVAGT
jgi:methyltransferase (TIGR00027 family)